jgi:cytochrome c
MPVNRRFYNALSETVSHHRCLFTGKEPMKLLPVFTLAVAVSAIGPALASEDLAKQKLCVTCHAVDKKLVGPSFKDIAGKYASQKDAADKLAEKVIKGGSGVWGPVPMPANASLSAGDSKTLVTWILSLK